MSDVQRVTTGRVTIDRDGIHACQFPEHVTLEDQYVPAEIADKLLTALMMFVRKGKSPEDIDAAYAAAESAINAATKE